MFSRAKSLKGLVGNVKFIIQYKTWASLIVFMLGYIAGTFHNHWFFTILELAVML